MFKGAVLNSHYQRIKGVARHQSNISLLAQLAVQSCNVSEAEPAAFSMLLIWLFFIFVQSGVCTGCFILKIAWMLYAVPVSWMESDGRLTRGTVSPLKSPQIYWLYRCSSHSVPCMMEDRDDV